MSVFEEDSFVILNDDASESVPVSGSFDATDSFAAFDGSVQVDDSVDDIFAAPSSDYGAAYSNGNDGLFGSNGEHDGPILPPPSEMESDEGFALREWRRQNAIQLEEKEKREKELLNQIIEEANQYKEEFHKKIEVTCQNNKAANREKEKLYLENQEKFYAESSKNYWKAIAELVPKEVPTIEKRRGKKEQDPKKPTVSVIQGPKPGKPTDLTRMRQILVKLKHNPPSHLKLTSQPPSDAVAPPTPPKNVPETKPTEAVAAA
ncbi:PREDICTED: clathrin light chain 2 isoform X1 [Camelina sativa]|uniref:Clathrin light chain n=1 Tax=Camelina sativa TaxID=90675 RepID=A0ABM0ZLG0_CAMSA|nr:PREDICTED: clathrin light chain 2 isoform X2 [Camelina sativa]XP_019102554.1 PREDICTED: clathrin light chain 2 isoform X1 [Camelina sativa]